MPNTNRMIFILTTIIATSLCSDTYEFDVTPPQNGYVDHSYIRYAEKNEFKREQSSVYISPRVVMMSESVGRSRLPSKLFRDMVVTNLSASIVNHFDKDGKIDDNDFTALIADPLFNTIHAYEKELNYELPPGEEEDAAKLEAAGTLLGCYIKNANTEHPSLRILKSGDTHLMLLGRVKDQGFYNAVVVTDAPQKPFDHASHISNLDVFRLSIKLPSRSYEYPKKKELKFIHNQLVKYKIEEHDIPIKPDDIILMGSNELFDTISAPLIVIFTNYVLKYLENNDVRIQGDPNRLDEEKIKTMLYDLIDEIHAMDQNRSDTIIELEKLEFQRRLLKKLAYRLQKHNVVLEDFVESNIELKMQFDKEQHRFYSTKDDEEKREVSQWLYNVKKHPLYNLSHQHIEQLKSRSVDPEYDDFAKVSRNMFRDQSDRLLYFQKKNTFLAELINKRDPVCSKMEFMSRYTQVGDLSQKEDPIISSTPDLKFKINLNKIKESAKKAKVEEPDERSMTDVIDYLKNTFLRFTPPSQSSLTQADTEINEDFFDSKTAQQLYDIYDYKPEAQNLSDVNYVDSFKLRTINEAFGSLKRSEQKNYNGGVEDKHDFNPFGVNPQGLDQMNFANPHHQQAFDRSPINLNNHSIDSIQNPRRGKPFNPRIIQKDGNIVNNINTQTVQQLGFSNNQQYQQQPYPGNIPQFQPSQDQTFFNNNQLQPNDHVMEFDRNDSNEHQIRQPGMNEQTFQADEDEDMTDVNDFTFNSLGQASHLPQQNDSNTLFYDTECTIVELMDFTTDNGARGLSSMNFSKCLINVLKKLTVERNRLDAVGYRVLSLALAGAVGYMNGKSWGVTPLEVRARLYGQDVKKSIKDDVSIFVTMIKKNGKTSFAKTKESSYLRDLKSNLINDQLGPLKELWAYLLIHKRNIYSKRII